jgi:hypothetical protein
MNADAPGRALPAVDWDSLSLQQIWEYLNPTESEEDIYRVTVQFGEWAETLDGHLQQHQVLWTDVSGEATGDAHLAAVEFGATTRGEMAAAVTDLYQLQSSLDRLTATFVEVRRQVDSLYQQVQSTHEPLLDWVLARDDEPRELLRRDNTQRARGLMRGYEQTANEELSRWPVEGHHHTVAMSYAGDSATTTAPLRGDDAATKPTLVNDTTPISRGQDTNTAGGAAFPGIARPFDEVDHEHQSHVHAPDDEFLDSRTTIAPPVIGAGYEFEKDEDSAW